jgi:hypothetical protein
MISAPHGPEQIIETYYSFPLGALRATVDYVVLQPPSLQPGPRSGLGAGMRLHAQF